MHRSLSVPLVTLLLLAMIGTVAAQTPAGRAREIGVPAGRTAFEYVGRLAQAGLSLTGYGYLTHIDGVPDSALFATANPLARNEQTARVTFVAHALPSQGFQVPNPSGTPALFALDSTGTETIFFSDKPSKRGWNDSASFARGTSIARYAVHFQDSVAALVPIDPNRGVVDVVGDLCQRSAAGFALNGEMLALGRTGLLVRTTVHGWSVRTSANGPSSVSMVAGNVVVTGQGSCRG